MERFWAFMTMRRLAYNTRKTYRDWVWRFAEFMDAAKLPELSTERKMEAFLTDLAVRLKVSESTQNQAFAALLCFFRDFRRETLERIDALRAKRPVSLRTSIPRADLWPALMDIEDAPGQPLRLIAFTLYGCGLRLNEGLNLRIRDLRLDRSEVEIRHAKHGGARLVPVPCGLVRPLQRQQVAARLVFDGDRERGLPTQIPEALARKYRKAAEQWSWAFLFPSARAMRHPESGQMVRWHVPDYDVQRSLRAAAAKHDLDGLLSPHVLRHCYADEFRDDVKVLQEVMGHKDVRTTMGYRHPRLISPLPLDEALSESLALRNGRSCG